VLVQSQSPQVRRSCPRRGVRYPHLQLRRSTYYFRRPVPEELRETIGKRELIESLQTKDREEAKRRCHAKDVEVDRLFEVARRGVELSQPEADALARQWLDKALSEDADSRALGRYRLPPWRWSRHRMIWSRPSWPKLVRRLRRLTGPRSSEPWSCS